MRSEKKGIVFYGATWCGDCRRSKEYLDTRHIPFTYINIDDDPDAVELVKKVNHGLASIPTIIFPDGQVLVEPTDQELAEAIDANREELFH